MSEALKVIYVAFGEMTNTANLFPEVCPSEPILKHGYGQFQEFDFELRDYMKCVERGEEMRVIELNITKVGEKFCIARFIARRALKHEFDADEEAKNGGKRILIDGHVIEIEFVEQRHNLLAFINTPVIRIIRILQAVFSLRAP